MSAASRLVHRIAGQRESGIAMILALAVMLILSLLTVALGSLAVSEYSTAATLDRSTQALLAAEAGGERAIEILRPDIDWSDNATTTSWQAISGTQPEAFPAVGTPVGQYNIQVRHQVELDPVTNIVVRVIGQVGGGTRTIQYLLHRVTGADFVTYSIETVDTTNITGGGSIQWHGSVYIEDDLIFKGGTQAGFYNDRKVLSSDLGFLNNIYVCGWDGADCTDGQLDISTGNPTIGQPYYYVHVTGNPGVIGSSVNYDVDNFDNKTPDRFYPDVLQAAKDALTTPGNRLEVVAGQMQMVVCFDLPAPAGWSRQTLPNLTLLPPPAPPFYLPKAGTDCPAAGDPTTITAIKSDPSLYMLAWDPVDSVNLTFENPNVPIYIPGSVVIGADVRYEGKGTVIVANQPGATSPDALQPQNGCALDFNTSGACVGVASTGHTIKASISPCQGSPGTDNPSTTFPATDLAAFVVNGRAYVHVNANSCAQEMNLIAIVGVHNTPPAATCQARAGISMSKKLQWYGVLMTREICLGQVPDFWQMPDMINALPAPLKDIITVSNGPIQVRNWQELF